MYTSVPGRGASYTYSKAAAAATRVASHAGRDVARPRPRPRSRSQSRSQSRSHTHGSPAMCGGRTQAPGLCRRLRHHGQGRKSLPRCSGQRAADGRPARWPGQARPGLGLAAVVFAFRRVSRDAAPSGTLPERRRARPGRHSNDAPWPARPSVQAGHHHHDGAGVRRLSRRRICRARLAPPAVRARLATDRHHHDLPTDRRGASTLLLSSRYGRQPPVCMTIGGPTRGPAAAAAAARALAAR